MKHLYLILLIICTPAITFSQGRGNDVPTVVMKSMNSNFPAASKVEWERKGNIYQAEFKVDDIEHKARFDQNGHLEVYKKDINSKELPSPVQRTIRREYKGFKIDDAAKVTRDGKALYQVELESSSLEQKLVFTPDGKVASNETYW
jgi:hypothetical protein